MDPIWYGIIGILALLGLIAIRIPIAVSLFAVSFVGLWLAYGHQMAFGLISTVLFPFAASWTLSAVPMFLFMGFVAYHSGLTRGLFHAARAWLGVLPGGLAVASIFASGGFSAVTGSSVACAAAMGRIAVPEMEKSGYAPSIAAGTVAAAGTIGALIPPSIILILFGIQAEVSILSLFFGGLLIGLATVIAYSATVVGLAIVRPDLMPRGDAAPMHERLTSLVEVWPVIFLITAVFGGMAMGWFTATEGGAIGALLIVLIGLARRRLGHRALIDSTLDTILSTGSLFMVAIGANAFSRFVALTGIATEMGNWVTGLGLTEVPLLFLVSIIYLALGMFLEPVGALLLTLPIILPILESAGVQILWFGILAAKLLEMGMLTPPVGLNVFVIHGVAQGRIPLETIFRGVVWFLVADAVLVVLLIVFREDFAALLR